MKKLMMVLVGVMFLGAGVSMAGEKDARATYEKYVAKSVKLKSFNDIKPFLSKNALKEREKLSKKQMGMALEMLQDMHKSIYKQIKGGKTKMKISGDKATITGKATVNDTPLNITVKMLKENGTWKVDKEDFKFKM